MASRFVSLIVLMTLLSPAQVGAQEPYTYDPFDEHVNAPRLPSLKLPLLTGTKQVILEDEDRSRKPSRMEAYYARRIVDELPQFGYDLFQSEVMPADFMPAGAVQDDYVLGIGDRLNVVMRGQVNSQKIYWVSSDGLLVLDGLVPVPAAGRSLRQIESALKSLMSAQPNQDLYVSLDKVRQINVLVIGHVHKPGRQTLTVFHTLLDALSLSGGVQKDGSLRSIKLVRQGRTQLIDLYGLLVYGSDLVDVRLQDGDRLIVPPLGPTMAISGGVKRPGIYELRTSLRGMQYAPEGRSEAISMEEALNLAGGVLVPGQNRFMKLAVTQNGYEDVVDVNQPFAPVFSDGSILMVGQQDEARQGQVELSGAVRAEGIFPLKTHQNLSTLLSSEILKEDVYPLLGVIERYDPDKLTREFFTFPLHLVLSGKFDKRLQNSDIIHLFSISNILSLGEDPVMMPRLIPSALSQEVGSTSFDPANVSDMTPILRDVLKEHAVQVKGAVRMPSGYPVAEGTTLDDVLSVSGGLTLEANAQRIEVTAASLGQEDDPGRSKRALIDLSLTDPHIVILSPGDSVRVNQKVHKIQNNTVYLSGAVIQPGEYNLMPGDRLSSLIARAGGLSVEAYPDGAIFSRASERKAEEQRYQAAARDMERALAVAMEKDREDRPNDAQISLAKSLAQELKNTKAVGRLTVEANPDKLLSAPELDILLEAGDRIYIPQRPYNVRVRGEVLSPSNLQFRSGKSPRDYLMEAGGFTHFADKDRAFVIYPDGSAQPLSVGHWNYDPVMIPPGSTIVVPRDPKPFDFMQTAKDISQILGNLAVSAVVIDDIRDN